MNIACRKCGNNIFLSGPIIMDGLACPKCGESVPVAEMRNADLLACEERAVRDRKEARLAWILAIGIPVAVMTGLTWYLGSSYGYKLTVSILLGFSFGFVVVGILWLVCQSIFGTKTLPFFVRKLIVLSYLASSLLISCALMALWEIVVKYFR
jgi:hypothetical protein